jgi:hypothetical protein
MRIRILIKVVRICHHLPSDPAGSIVSLQGELSWLHFSLDRSFFLHFYADTDTNPASKTADPDSEPQRWKKCKNALFLSLLDITIASLNLKNNWRFIIDSDLQL